MATIGARQIIVAFLLLGFFTFAIISFAVNFQGEWEANSSILDNPTINTLYTGVNDTFKSSRTTTDSYSDTLYNESMAEKSGGFSQVLFGGIIAITRSFTGIASNVFTAILDPLMATLGLGSEATAIIGTLLATIFGIVVIFLAWRLFRRGD